MFQACENDKKKNEHQCKPKSFEHTVLMERLETEICRLVSGPPIDVLIGLINWLKRELSLREGVVLGPLGR